VFCVFCVDRRVSYANSITPVMMGRSAVSCTAWPLFSIVSRLNI
jgi:hypothetical protein